MIELGLQRISRLLERTPLPWRAIHVAGTNGKGTVCNYVSRMLEAYNRSEHRTAFGAASLKHARFTSPHLIDRWDGITINQETVPFKLFDHLERQVLKRNKEEHIRASEFELLTAVAFEIFTHEEVDVGVVEVGMGGRLDATNIIGQLPDNVCKSDVNVETFRPPALVCAITKLGMDHQAFLGDTILDIAREKAGIIETDVPFTYDTSNVPDVVESLLAKAEHDGCDMVTASSYRMPTHLLDPDLVHSTLGDEALLQPAHDTEKQLPFTKRRNLEVAFCASWTALQRLGRVPKDPHHLTSVERQAVASLATSFLSQEIYETDFPGRLQMLSIERLTGRRSKLLLDGAHNAQSAEFLASTVRKTFRTHSSNQVGVTWVIATSDSKDPIEIVEPLLQDGDCVFAVEFGPVAGMPWIKATSTNKILDAIARLSPKVGKMEAHKCSNDVLRAVKAASQKADEGPLVVGGSLYLVGDVLRLLRDSK